MYFKFLRSIACFFLLAVCHSCKDSSTVSSHRGVVKNDMHVEMLDSITLQMDSTSMRGNFFMRGNELFFADVYFNKLFLLGTDDGMVRSARFNKGKASNEISNFMFMYPIENNENTIFFIDSSCNFFTFTDTAENIQKHGMIDFGWKKMKKGDYESPSVYNIMEMSDFDFKISQINDSVYIIPVSLISRNLGEKTVERFKKGHIFASLNKNTMDVDNVFGRFPDIYSDKPTNLFEFFSYDMAGDTIFVSHCIDSTIYVYKYPDELLFTMGYECPDIDRDYTTGHDIDWTIFGKDREHVGINTQIYHSNTDDTLLRIMNTGSKNGNKHYMQVYRNCDLVAEVEVPAAFKCLGNTGNTYYAVNMIPTVTGGKETFTLYKFRIR